MNKIPISQLRQLLTEVSQHGNQHLVEVEADLLQTQYLLTEAIEKLGKSFENIHQSIINQQILLDELLLPYALDGENPLVKQLDDIKARVGADVGEVVTSMQFQDLTSQLLVRSLQRITGIKEIMEALGTHGHTDDVCPVVSEQAEIMEYIEDLKQALNMKSHALKGGFQKRSVSQENMDSGDIELF